jgi:hypothetical protein
VSPNNTWGGRGQPKYVPSHDEGKGGSVQVSPNWN